MYEPLGIVNLEAMACGAAVVGTATGGIPEVVVDGVTGRLVPIEQVQDGTGTPVDPDRYVDDLARVLTEVVSDPARAAEYGRAGRERATERLQLGSDRRHHRGPLRRGRERRTRRAQHGGGRDEPLGWPVCRTCWSSPTSLSVGTAATSSIGSRGPSTTTNDG